MHVVLLQPEIAPNTGNIIRLCANTGCDLHLVEPLGFSLDDTLLKRAGLDYHERTTVTVHRDLGSVRAALPGRWWFFSARASRRFTDVAFDLDDVLVFGCESAGLPAEVLDAVDPDQQLTIPLLPGNRSLNLGNAAAVAIYEAWRQHDHVGAGPDNNRTAPLAAERFPPAES